MSYTNKLLLAGIFAITLAVGCWAYPTDDEYMDKYDRRVRMKDDAVQKRIIQQNVIQAMRPYLIGAPCQDMEHGGQKYVIVQVDYDKICIVREDSELLELLKIRR